VLETKFVEDVVLTGVVPDRGICFVNLIFLSLFFEVTTISLVPKSLMQGQTNVTTGLSVLLSIGICSLRGTIAVVAILVKGHTFPTNVKVYPVIQIVLWYLHSEYSKHMTEDYCQLINFVHKFLGTVKFENDHVAKIMGYVGNKMHKAFLLPGESSHWQYKFPLPVESVPTARRMEIPLPGVCTAMMKKLPVKDRWQLH
nr:integrase, catalytic region, zinc finger, CCHC-type, peptidase aspartic, catalytic [Tanacetum cinerariifolium]